jgi:tellurite methyltransferase
LVKEKQDHPTGFARYDAVAGLGAARFTLLRALSAIEAESHPPGLAIDIGCGIGRDTLPLLRRRWRVLAIDRRDSALDQLRCLAEKEGLAGLETLLASMEDASLPKADLINASFSLFLCQPDRFQELWTRIRNALQPGGRFSGQLMGPRDSWADRGGLTVHDRYRVERLLEGFEVEWLEEEQSGAVTPQGEPKRWHLWHVVARAP